MLRAADSPAGADFRALDAAIARELGRLAAVEVALRWVELAGRRETAVVQVNKDAMRNDADPTSIGTRAFDAVHFAKDQLRAVVEELARVRDSEPALIARLSGFATLGRPTSTPRLTLAVESSSWSRGRGGSRACCRRCSPRSPASATASAPAGPSFEQRQRDAAGRPICGAAPSSGGHLKTASGLRPQASKIEPVAPVVRLRIRNPRPEA